ncbi:hypothetical protein G7Y79_00019g046670 [Physcia stellaris]|nr:hypothetical protein G7Y79_00019g046670 [Physcia stellaris]
MARKAEDRPVAVKEPQQPKAAPEPRKKVVHPGLAMIAANLEREIDEDITKLEQLWYPLEASGADNDGRLEATTRILIEMVEEDEASPTYDPGGGKKQGHLKGDGGIEGVAGV